MSAELGVVKETVYVELLVCTIFKISGEHGAVEKNFKSKCVDKVINVLFLQDLWEFVFSPYCKFK